MNGGSVAAPSGPLAAAGLLDFAGVYAALFKSSGGRILPSDADAMEAWEAAVLLGLSEEVTPPDSKDPRVRQQTHQTRSRELLRQRVAHARGEAPAPEARAPDPQSMAALMNLAGR